MGVDKFRETCRSYGQEISQELAEKAVYTWRKVHPIIVDCWRSIDDAAKMAIRNPGKIYVGTPRTGRIRFGMTSKAGFPALVMILPSGHKLVYPKAKIVPNWSVFVNRKANKFSSYAAAVKFCNAKKIDRDQIREGSEINYWGKLPGKGGTQWGWLSTYGGKLLENATQAVAGDIMTNGALNAERAGFDIAMLVHDQALALFRQGQDHENFPAALCELPAWADGLPVEAEGGFCKFYQKD